MPAMAAKRVLLLGAGFSRNWGGWLASEAFEYLLGNPELDRGGLRDILWRNKRNGGFEAALAELQTEAEQRGQSSAREHLIILESAILEMFADMDKGFASLVTFEWQNQRGYLVRDFLVRFDAIFTLNQDLLMERHYLNGSVALSSSRQWGGWQIPGMKDVPGEGLGNPAISKRSPMNSTAFAVEKNLQPYFKLHGSSNWVDERTGRPVFIMGGNKVSGIKQHPILTWNHECFTKYLSGPDTRLMIIGYSFGDEHVNRAVVSAGKGGNLRIFVIDPLGVDAADKNRDIAMYMPGQLFTELQPWLLGASRRSLRDIFGTDRVEHGKVMRFLGSVS